MSEFKDYNCVIFKAGDEDTYKGYFFLHLWETGTKPPHLGISVYDSSLDVLLDLLVKESKEFPLRSITTVPARTYLVLMDSEEVPIPDEDLAKFISGYKQRTKKMDNPSNT